MIVIVMGVAGSGKSTIGQRLAERLGWPFFDGDDFHPARNVEKMRQGQPLTDEDRADWLSVLAALSNEQVRQGQSAVIACSALKQAYRDRLRTEAVRFVYLRGSADLIATRLRQRRGHYMPVSLLASQFATLEEPQDALTVDIDQPPEQIVASIITALQVT
jgi:gluconokinase